MNNLEWLYSLEGEERQKWFDAEHVDANDELSAKNDVNTADMDANDVDVDSREMRVVFPRHNGEKQAKLLVKQFRQLIHGELHDSREKLEADVNQYVMQQVNSTITWEAANEMKAAMLGMLDRQAAIDRKEFETKNAELTAQLYELTAERDNLARDLAESERLREQLREKLGAACDHAHDMLALVDLDGEVVS